MTPEAVAVINAAQAYVASEQRLNAEDMDGPLTPPNWGDRLEDLIADVASTYQTLVDAVEALHEKAER